MPAMGIAPQRTEQIQQALIEAGDLHEQPTGKWDLETRDAMKVYQHTNGFSATGLPDAKSLMKMGLGPHPLPSDVYPIAQAQPGFTPPADGRHASLSNTSPDD
ncbi:MAG: peptidoglycan-binding domain-containing protein [Terriglobia bacterium]